MSEARKIGSYELIDEIGRGGMGAVFQAKAQDGAIVALKMLKRDLLGEEEFLQRFLRESRVSIRLNHPNVVRYYESFETEEGLFLVMEYVDGGDAGKILDRTKRMRELDALNMMAQVADGLHHAHQQNLIHRDIKPQNIFLTRDGVAKLADLGLARSISAAKDAGPQLTMEGQILGTPYYMSPEQAAGNRRLDHRADIYSMGATLFHLLCGRPPFKHKNIYAIINDHIAAPPPDPRQYTPALSDATCAVILDCMAKRPDDRPQTASELAGRLLEAAAILKPESTDALTTLPADVVEAAMPSHLRPRSTPQPSSLLQTIQEPTVKAELPPSAVKTMATPAPVPASRETLATGIRGNIRIHLQEAQVDLHLVAKPFVNFGKQRSDPNDICLRLYPVSQYREACNHISHLHWRLILDENGAWVEDLGSRNGLEIDGTPVLADQPSLLRERGKIRVADVLWLRYRLQGDAQAGPPDAVVLTRPENRSEMVFAVVRTQVNVGGELLPPSAGISWPVDAFRIVYAAGSFYLAPGSSPTTLSGDEPLTEPIPLAPGTTWYTGGVPLSFHEHDWDRYR